MSPITCKIQLEKQISFAGYISAHPLSDSAEEPLITAFSLNLVIFALSPMQKCSTLKALNPWGVLENCEVIALQ